MLFFYRIVLEHSYRYVQFITFGIPGCKYKWLPPFILNDWLDVDVSFRWLVVPLAGDSTHAATEIEQHTHFVSVKYEETEAKQSKTEKEKEPSTMMSWTMQTAHNAHLIFFALDFRVVFCCCFVHWIHTTWQEWNVWKIVCMCVCCIYRKIWFSCTSISEIIYCHRCMVWLSWRCCEMTYVHQRVLCVYLIYTWT